MKKLLLPLLLTIIGCAAPNSIQLCTVKPKSEITQLTFSDEYISVLYDFWSQQGRGRCGVYNYSDSFLYLNLKECLFVCNGNSEDFYSNVTSTTVTHAYYPIDYLGPIMISQGTEITYTVDPIIVLPPKSGKVIRLPSISNSYVTNCNNDSVFTSQNAPISFKYILSYSFQPGNSLSRITNEFYVQSLKEVSSYDFWEYVYEKECGRTKWPLKQIAVSKYYSPDKFYVSY